MKEIYEDEIIKRTKYEAVDGTKFNDREECKKYEDSAKCAIAIKFKKLIIEETDAYSLLRGDEERKVLAIKINTEQDKDVVHQMYFISGNSYLLQEDNKTYLSKWEQLVDDTYKHKDVLLLGVNYDGELWYIDRVQNIIDRLNTLGKHDS